MRAAAVVFILALLIGSIPTILDILPSPAVHDEFAYLLQADTFAGGRMTNPTHPHWQFFETIHVLQQPTYAAKFPPAQGLALAAGMRFGNPIVGAFGAVALACAATAWMLIAWMPRRWAIAGGALAATHPVIFGWGQSFWGGGVAMLGAALACGAMLRLHRRSRAWHGVILGTGIAILANSRPFEGVLLLGLMTIGIMAFHGSRARAADHLRFGLFPAAALLLPVVALMAFYNYRVTGDLLRLPYSEHARQYMLAPLFWWQPQRELPVSYRNEAVSNFHRFVELNEWKTQRNDFIRGAAGKWREIARDWLWPPTILLGFAGLCFSPRSTKAAFAGVICLGLPLLHMLLTPWFRPHYLAVTAPMFVALAAIGLRSWSLRGWGGTAVIAIVLIGQLAAVGWEIRRLIVEPNVAGEPRRRLIEELARLPGEHLVFVRYEGSAQTILEWVYNSAEIDRQRIVFARDIGDANPVLQAYFANRSAWLVSVRGVAVEVRPLP